MAENYDDVLIDTTYEILSKYSKSETLDKEYSRELFSDNLLHVFNFLILWIIFESVVKESTHCKKNIAKGITQFVDENFANLNFANLKSIFVGFYRIYGKEGQLHCIPVQPPQKEFDVSTFDGIFNCSKGEYYKKIENEPMLKGILLMLKGVRNNFIHNDSKVTFTECYCNSNKNHEMPKLAGVVTSMGGDDKFHQMALFCCASKLLQELLLKNFRNVKQKQKTKIQ